MMKNANFIGTPNVTFVPGDVYEAQTGSKGNERPRPICKLGDLYPAADWKALRLAAVKRRDYDLALKQDARQRRVKRIKR